MYRERYVITVSYVLSDLTTTIYFSILKQNLILICGPLVSKDHRFYHKTHINCGSLMGGKSLIIKSTNSCLLKTYDLILDILLL
jgi:hypothetical protein